MFKFNFEDDPEIPPEPSTGIKEIERPCTSVSLVELLDSLPPLLSYSPIKIPLSDGELVLPRRDLFDARFQLISQAADDKYIDGLEYLEAPSDLVPGIYEGGLKTWECSLDLVDVLNDAHGKDVSLLPGKSVLELGCGTAIPSLYLLRRLFFSKPENDNAQTHFHLQDFNRSVLELVTLPNIILTWYMSPASQPYRDALHEETTELEPDPDAHPLPSADPSEPSELPVNPSLVAGFLESLTTFNIHLYFTYGSWSTFTPTSRFDIVLTSETIYRKESLPSLLDVMWKASTPQSQSDSSLDQLATSKLVLEDMPSPVCYVATKVLYFGVGGGIPDFVEAVQTPQKSTKIARGPGQVELIKEHVQGVGRKVMRVRWD